MQKRMNEPDLEKRQMVLDMRLSGMTYKEIADAMGYKCDAWVCKVCRESGLGGTSSWKTKKYNEYRDYKAQGHTHAEVAERFGISIATAISACKGVAPQQAVCKGEQQPAWLKNKYTNGNFDREQNARRWVEKAGFEYAGNFTGVDGFVDICCPKCKVITRKSFVSIRHGTAKCDNCYRLALEEKENEKKEAAEERKAQAQKRKAEKDLEAFMSVRLVECVECGKIFETRRARQVCCSPECSRKRANRASSHRKDARISVDKRIDKDITVTRLYKRDNGRCWICGGLCDKDDYEVKSGTIICGNNYPSVDHVIPICNGGTDAWENVKLAHRLCNSKRYWENITPPASVNL